MLVSKAGTCPSEAPFKDSTPLWYALGHNHKQQMRMERLAKDKHKHS